MPVEPYLQDLCADMRHFRASATYERFVADAEAGDGAQTAAHLTALTTERAGATEHNESVYEAILAGAYARSYRIRVQDDPFAPVRAIHVDDRVITVSAYGDITTLQLVVLVSLFMMEIRATPAGLRMPHHVLLAHAYGAAYCVLRALGIHNPNVARALVLEGVTATAVEQVSHAVTPVCAAFLDDLPGVMTPPPTRVP